MLALTRFKEGAASGEWVDGNGEEEDVRAGEAAALAGIWKEGGVACASSSDCGRGEGSYLRRKSRNWCGLGG